MRTFSLMTLALVGLSSAPAFAAPTVAISSYVYVETNSNVAELCGKATGITAPTVVHANIDVGSKHPARYNTVVDADGSFCMMVLTYRGTATVELGGVTVQAPLAQRP